MLPPVMLPVAVTTPPVVKLPPVTLAVALTKPLERKLPASTLAVTFKLVPVAAPILGVVKLALALTMMLPLPSNAVVLLSTLAENTVPFRLIPAAVLAE